MRWNRTSEEMIIEDRHLIGAVIAKAREYLQTGDWTVEKAIHVHSGFLGLSFPRYRLILRPSTSAEKKAHIELEESFRKAKEIAENPIKLARKLAEKIKAERQAENGVLT